MKVYVEGGGNYSSLKTLCRKGFKEFFEKAGLKGRVPRIIACGGRADAYRSFSIAIKSGENAVLLVDSEAPVSFEHQKGKPSTWKPWEHLRLREGDQWSKPQKSRNNQCHLMTQCMESWFLADRQLLKEYFGPGFRERNLPAQNHAVETIEKKPLFKALADATKYCSGKGPYHKGDHSFKILALLDPEKVMAGSPWAQRLVKMLIEIMENDKK